MTPFKKEMLLELPTKDGVQPITLTGPLEETITSLLTRMPLPSEPMLFLMLPLIFISKINRLTMEVMLGDKLMVKMLLLIRQLMPINSDMELSRVILIPILEMVELLVFLI